MNEYEKKAFDFCKKFSVTVDVVKYPEALQSDPLWAEGESHGHKYNVKIVRGEKEYRFDFWDSIANRYDRKRPTKYDVLACLDTYTDDSMSLGDFMSEFGYDVEQVDMAQKTLLACQEQSRALRDMFSEEELRELSEIS